MDEGVKETACRTIDEDDLSPNRNLRDQMDGTSVKSPRKSPRLMTQGRSSEEVHIYRQQISAFDLVWADQCIGILVHC